MIISASYECEEILFGRCLCAQKRYWQEKMLDLPWIIWAAA